MSAVKHGFRVDYGNLSAVTNVVLGACVVSAAINKSLVSRNYWSQRDKYLAAAFKSGDEGIKMTPQSIILSNGFPPFVYLGPCSIPLDRGVRDFMNIVA